MGSEVGWVVFGVDGDDDVDYDGWLIWVGCFYYYDYYYCCCWCRAYDFIDTTIFPGVSPGRQTLSYSSRTHCVMKRCQRTMRKSSTSS